MSQVKHTWSNPAYGHCTKCDVPVELVENGEWPKTCGEQFPWDTYRWLCDIESIPNPPSWRQMRVGQ